MRCLHTCTALAARRHRAVNQPAEQKDVKSKFFVVFFRDKQIMPALDRFSNPISTGQNSKSKGEERWLEKSVAAQGLDKQMKRRLESQEPALASTAAEHNVLCDNPPHHILVTISQSGPAAMPQACCTHKWEHRLKAPQVTGAIGRPTTKSSSQSHFSKPRFSKLTCKSLLTLHNTNILLQTSAPD